MSRLRERLRALGLSVGLALAVTAVLSGGSAPPPASTLQVAGQPHAAAEPVRPPVPAGPPGLALGPAPGAAAVPVTVPVTVAATAATLDAVSLADAQGRPVPGDFTDVYRRGWHTSAPLAYSTRYTLSASGTGAEGQKVSQTSTFTTVHPANVTMPYLQANSGLSLAGRDTYGVGQVIVVHFDEHIPDRAAAQRALSVFTDPPAAGAWHWIDDQDVHWRPQAYWKPGTRVSVTAATYGVDLGGGLYGQGDAAAQFTVGPSHVAVADDLTHQIQVYIDGQLVRDVPTAMGMHTGAHGAHGEYIDFHTRSGVHVVLGNARVTRMTSASFGITTGPFHYDENVEWTTHVSYAGEYIHAAPWSVQDQGHRDVSHGCMNVNTQNAIWFYNTFVPGDVVDVRNTGVPLDLTDGIGDWNVPWPDWTAGSAVPVPPPAHQLART